MVEKVEGVVEDGPAHAADAHPFTSENVQACNSCLAANPVTATRCGGCGQELTPKDSFTVATVPATCPHCAGDRPMLPKQDQNGFETGMPKDSYHGNCPHCGQTPGSADAAKAALEKGQFPEWGQQSSKFYP